MTNVDLIRRRPDEACQKLFGNIIGLMKCTRPREHQGRCCSSSIAKGKWEDGSAVCIATTHDSLEEGAKTVITPLSEVNLYGLAWGAKNSSIDVSARPNVPDGGSRGMGGDLR